MFLCGHIRSGGGEGGMRTMAKEKDMCFLLLWQMYSCMFVSQK